MLRRALLCTLGPSSLKPEVIRKFESAGVSSLRVNMSHTSLPELERILKMIRAAANVPICLDSEGAQLRTGTMASGARVDVGSKVRLVAKPVVGRGPRIPVTPADAVGRFEKGARVSVDFDSVVLRVDQVGEEETRATVLVGGEIGSRKAVTAFPSPALPAFSEKDLAAIEIGVASEVRQFALSFCEQASSVSQLRDLVGPSSVIMAKIESRKGVRNMNRIAQAADRLIIDRGDLSREVRLEAIPLLQKAIIHKANALGVPVYVATNLLESMVTRRTPTRAEVNDVMSTLLDGADGLVLAAETAVGQYPVEAVEMIVALLREYEASIDGYRIEDLLGDHPLSADEALPEGPDRS